MAAGKSAWKNFLFSDVIMNKSPAHKIAYIAVMTALCIVSNIFELKFAHTQFSFTIFTSMLAGIVIGPLPGAAAAFLGDLIGFLVNGLGRFPFYWWVSISIAFMAIIAGFVMRLPLRFRGSMYGKLAISCLLAFFVCSFLVNSLCGYYIELAIYFPKAFLEYLNEKFGGESTFGAYLLYRFFITGQIWNNLVNYVLLFLVLPTLKAIKPLKLNIQ